VLVPTLIDRFAARLGFERAGTPYGSNLTDPSGLSMIALQRYFDAAEPHIAVNRRSAMTVGTISAGRQVIAANLGRLTWHAKVGAQIAREQPPLLAQPEWGVPRSTTMAWTFDDLMFYPHAWWIVDRDAPGGGRDFYGWPTWVRRVPPHECGFDAAGVLVKAFGRAVDPRDVFRFDSPLGEGLLETGKRTIRRAIAIELAASHAENNPVPSIDLHDTAEPALVGDALTNLLDSWKEARAKGGSAYTPKRIEAKALGQHPEQLLIEGRRAISLDLVRHMAMPAWAASTAVEGATMTYDNRALRNWELIDLTYAGYLAAVGDRLSMPDMTPRGWTVDADIDGFTRPDQKTRFETYAIGLDKGFIDQSYIDAQEGWTQQGATR